MDENPKIVFKPDPNWTPEEVLREFDQHYATKYCLPNLHLTDILEQDE